MSQRDSGYHKLYYKKNRDKLKANAAARYAALRNIILEQQSDPEYRTKRKAYYDSFYSNPIKIEIRRKKYRERIYGISPERFDELFAWQKECCAICGNPFKNTKDTCIDHCHKTGKIRGILCNRCNRAIGLLREDSAIIQSAAEYIAMHGENTPC